ncbi:MAG: type IV toxin-antitoxin system AbiEi family antitoxin domain-containing protein [Actinomycetota bacterium]|nr:type IV toxin-antitoxin system AbiEi family antitoxin domain-containing protein [Actinomycetota bacterium]
MDDYLRHICTSSGAFLRREAIAIGYDDRRIAKLVRQHTWHRIRHGAYTFEDTWQPLNQEQRHLLTAAAVLRAARAPVALSHTSALLQHGMPAWGIPLEDVHLTRLDQKSGRRQAGVAQHRGALLADDLTIVQGVSVTSPTRTALDLTTIADVQHSLVAVDALLKAKLTTQEDLRRRNEAMRCWPNTLSTDLVIRLSDGRAESVGESRTRYLLWRGGIPAPQSQFEIFGAFGQLVATVDFAWPGHGLFLEFDGRVKYTSLLKSGELVTDVVLREKRREELICELTGWRCIRLIWADLERPEATLARIRRALGSPATLLRPTG